MDSILNMIAEYKVVLAAAGGLAAVSFIVCLLLHQLEWLSIWNKLYPIGKVFDKFLQLKFKWLESLVENVGILGLIPAAISMFAGMTEGNMELRLRLKNILVEMAAKL